VTLLLTGFGPFLDVRDNPSARLVRDLHGRRLGGHEVHGEVLPVSYRRAPARVVALVQSMRPVAVIGFGVARERTGVQVESTAWPEAIGEDVDQHCPVHLSALPGSRACTLDPARLAHHLGATVSHDAGRYVCNAWLYLVPAAVPCPAAFVHLPAEGVPAEAVAAGLQSWLEETAPG
jgi:pyroglutamyl-peptidase